MKETTKTKRILKPIECLIIGLILFCVFGCPEPITDDSSGDYYCRIGYGDGWGTETVDSIEYRDNILIQMESLGLLESRPLEALSRLVGIEGQMSGSISGGILGIDGGISGSIKTEVSILFAWRLDRQVYLTRLPYNRVFFEIDETYKKPSVKIRWHLYHHMPLGQSINQISKSKYIYSAKIIASSDDLQNGIYIKIFI